MSADTMTEIPESEMPRPHRPSLVEKVLGVRPDPSLDTGEPEGDPYLLHAEFERQQYHDHDRTKPTDCEGMLRVADRDGIVWPCICDVCGFEVGVPMKRIDPSRLLDHRLSRAGLPPEFAGKAFERDEAAQLTALKAVREWLTAFRPGRVGELDCPSIPAIALWGEVGRGKSHLLSVMIESLVRTHSVRAVYRSAASLFDELQGAMDAGRYESRFEELRSFPVLALDDLGAGRMTDWRRDVLSNLVDYRYSKRLPLLIGTNIPPDRWTDVFGHRAASRMKGICTQIELKGIDRRAQQSLSF